LEVIPKLPLLYDEPFADPSQIPTALLCALTRQHVTVALSGDGGDEGFCGYSRYEQARAICSRMSRVPTRLLRLMSWSLAHVPISLWERLSFVARTVPAVRRRSDGIGYRILRLADRLGCTTPQQLYRHLMSYWAAPATLVVGGREPSTVLDEAPAKQDVEGFMDQMMLLDTLSYLPDDILVKVDRASMAVALEVRAPLLDHRVLEFAWRQPLAAKLCGGRGKLMLRRLLGRYVPAELWERPKTGFGVPVYHWLRGPLRDWAESLLDEARLQREGYLEPKPIRRLWRTLLSGQSEWAFGGELLWSVLMFQAWLEHICRDAPRQLCDDAAPRAFSRPLVATEVR
ncbi:MAG: asparagine synthetase B, partial [Gammaproteobacteria bacterium]|nr:asparagine synthetase B [Gammaproteobacteria bacterium]